MITFCLTFNVYDLSFKDISRRLECGLSYWVLCAASTSQSFAQVAQLPAVVDAELTGRGGDASRVAEVACALGINLQTSEDTEDGGRRRKKRRTGPKPSRMQATKQKEFIAAATNKLVEVLYLKPERNLNLMKLRKQLRSLWEFNGGAKEPVSALLNAVSFPTCLRQRCPDIWLGVLSLIDAGVAPCAGLSLLPPDATPLVPTTEFRCATHGEIAKLLGRCQTSLSHP